ncbi:MAG: Holliday junction resolvase [Dehalococcoidia bacterium]|nr:MAG: Holliday junction resolvase [Dehalococcoidia bacterium]
MLGIFLTYYFSKLKFEGKFRQWQETEKLRWEEERERAIKEAIAQSRAVLGGKFVEQLAPYLPEFKYDPTEARFIGSPIDLIVFPGLASGDPEEIVIMEIKTGKTGQLTPQERKIRQLIEDGMVRWELIQKPSQEA